MSIATPRTPARCSALSCSQKASRLSRVRSSATCSTRVPSRSLTTVTYSWRFWNEVSSTPT